MKQKIYISGKMTGLPNFNMEKFFEEEKKLIQQGFYVVNPARITLVLCKKLRKEIHEISRETFLKEDLKYLLDCDCIYMLKGYEYSDGAMLEKFVAESLKLKFYYEK